MQICCGITVFERMTGRCYFLPCKVFYHTLLVVKHGDCFSFPIPYFMYSTNSFTMTSAPTFLTFRKRCFDHSLSGSGYKLWIRMTENSFREQFSKPRELECLPAQTALSYLPQLCFDHRFPESRVKTDLKQYANTCFLVLLRIYKWESVEASKCTSGRWEHWTANAALMRKL